MIKNLNNYIKQHFTVECNTMCDLCQVDNCECECNSESKETLSKVELASTVFSAGKEHLRIADLGGAKYWFKCKRCEHYIFDALRNNRTKLALLKIQGYRCGICKEPIRWINKKAPEIYLHYTKLGNGNMPKSPLALDELEILCAKCKSTTPKTRARRL